MNVAITRQESIKKNEMEQYKKNGTKTAMLL